MSRIEALQNLLAATPDAPDPDVLYMLAQEHFKLGEHADAVRWYDRCLEASPGYCYAYYHKALALDADGRRDEGVETLRTGLAEAKRQGDGKASNEIALLIDEWT